MLTCDAWCVVLRWLPIVDTKRMAFACRATSLAARREVLARTVVMRDRFSKALSDVIERDRDRTPTWGRVSYDVCGSADRVKRILRRVIASWSATLIERGDPKSRIQFTFSYRMITVHASTRRHMRGRTVVHAVVQTYSRPGTTGVIEAMRRWSDAATAERELSTLIDDALDASYDGAADVNDWLIVADDSNPIDNTVLHDVARHRAHVLRIAARDMNRMARDVTLDAYQLRLDAYLVEYASFYKLANL